MHAAMHHRLHRHGAGMHAGAHYPSRLGAACHARSPHIGTCPQVGGAPTRTHTCTACAAQQWGLQTRTLHAASHLCPRPVPVQTVAPCVVLLLRTPGSHAGARRQMRRRGEGAGPPASLQVRQLRRCRRDLPPQLARKKGVHLGQPTYEESQAHRTQNATSRALTCGPGSLYIGCPRQQHEADVYMTERATANATANQSVAGACQVLK